MTIWLLCVKVVDDENCISLVSHSNDPRAELGFSKYTETFPASVPGSSMQNSGFRGGVSLDLLRILMHTITAHFQILHYFSLLFKKFLPSAHNIFFFLIIFGQVDKICIMSSFRYHQIVVEFL